MEIKYLGHSSFRLKGKGMSVVTDPFDSKMVGLPFPKVTAEIVTVSHQHLDHNQVNQVKGTENRAEPFVISRPGEYEIGGVGVIGIRSQHDDKKGEERGENVIFTIQIDGVIVCHLGDLGHELSDKQIERVGQIDVLLVPVGGTFTIGPRLAVETINALSPSVVVPMHYKRPSMGASFDQMVTVDEFLEKSGFGEVKRLEKLTLMKMSLPEEMEIVVLES